MGFDWDAIQVVFTDGNAFAGIRQRHQHFASGLAAEGLGILYIEEPGNWITVGLSPEKPRSNWTAWRKGPQEVEPNLWVWTPPPGMPVGYWSRGINLRNHRSYAEALTRVAGPIPRNRLLMLACNPLAVDWIRPLDPVRAIYDCCDEFTAFPLPSKRPEVVRALEQDLMAACDITIFSSGTTLRAKLGERRRPQRRGQGPRMTSPQGVPRKVVHLRNACDAAHFGTADPAVLAPPADLAPLLVRGPVLLYFGAIAAWFDEERISAVARAKPEWQFVLIGPVSRSLPQLKGRANVHVLGKRPYQELPAYVAHAAAGLLPNLRTLQQDQADHVKIYEYLAGGLGVMANPLTELQFFQRFVRLGSTTGEWVSGIEALLAADPAERAVRQTFAAQHTWAKRVAWLRQVLLRPDKGAVDAAKSAQWQEEERLLALLAQQAAAELAEAEALQGAPDD